MHQRLTTLALLSTLLLAPSWAAAQATRIRSSGTLPATCSVGNIYLKTGASAGFYVCLATNTWTVVGATPAGSDTQVQFNDSGVFGGDAGLIYDKTTDALTVGGNILSSALSIFIFPAPTLDGVAPGVGGSFAAGTYYFKIAAIDQLGNSGLLSNEISAVIPAPDNGNGSFVISFTADIPNATRLRVFFGPTTNGQNASFDVSFEASPHTQLFVPSGPAPPAIPNGYAFSSIATMLRTSPLSLTTLNANGDPVAWGGFVGIGPVAFGDGSNNDPYDEPAQLFISNTPGVLPLVIYSADQGRRLELNLNDGGTELIGKPDEGGGGTIRLVQEGTNGTVIVAADDVQLTANDAFVIAGTGYSDISSATKLGVTGITDLYLRTDAASGVEVTNSSGLAFAPLTASVVNAGFVATGTSPAVTDTSGGTSCGVTGNPSMVANSRNNAGAFNVGAGGGTDCTLTFTIAAPNLWRCSPSNETSAALVRAVSVNTTTTKFQGVLAAADVVGYVCTAH